MLTMPTAAISRYAPRDTAKPELFRQQRSLAPLWRARYLTIEIRLDAKHGTRTEIRCFAWRAGDGSTHNQQ